MNVLRVTSFVNMLVKHVVIVACRWVGIIVVTVVQSLLSNPFCGPFY